MANGLTPEQQVRRDKFIAEIQAEKDRLMPLLGEPLKALGYTVEFTDKGCFYGTTFALRVTDAHLPDSVGGVRIRSSILIEFDMKTKKWDWDSHTGVTAYKHILRYKADGNTHPKNVTPERLKEVVKFITEVYFPEAYREVKNAEDKVSGLGAQIEAYLMGHAPSGATRVVALGAGAEFQEVKVFDTYVDRTTTIRFAVVRSPNRLFITSETTVWSPMALVNTFSEVTDGTC